MLQKLASCALGAKVKSKIEYRQCYKTLPMGGDSGMLRQNEEQQEIYQLVTPKY